MSLGRGYRRLWSAATVSNLGDGVTLAALPLLAASITRDPGAVAAVTFAGRLPWLLFALPGGAIADRVDRRIAMVRTDLLRMLAIGALALAVVAHRESIALMAVIAFVLGSAETVFDNAAQAIMPSVVPRDQLEVANSRLYAAEIVTNQFAGPPLGSLLFALAASLPFLLDSVSFGLAALLVLGLHGSFRAARSPEVRTLRHDIAEGLRWLWAHRLLRTLGLALGVINLFESATIAVLVLYALEVLGLSNVGYGVLLTTGAFGALVSSFVAPRVTPRLGAGRVIVGAVVVLGITTLLPGIWANVPVVVVCFTLVGAMGVAWNIVTVSLRQAIVPDQLLGRVNSAYRLLGWGTMPLGAALGGFLATHYGLRSPYLVGGVATLLLAVVMAPIVRTSAIAAARAEAAGETPTT